MPTTTQAGLLALLIENVIWIRRVVHSRPTLCVALTAGWLIMAIPDLVGAGSNAGATARLSWQQSAQVDHLPASPSAPFRLYVSFQGLQDVSAATLTLEWSSEDSTGYAALSDTLSASCGRMLNQPPGASFLGDSAYTWEALGVVPSQCVTLLVSPPGHPASARFCLTDARVLDSTGAVDFILVTNSATIGDGPFLECQPQLYSASPSLVVPGGTSATSSRHKSARSETAGAHLPFVMLGGNNLQEIVSVEATGSRGELDIGTLELSEANVATASFPSLSGPGPWSVRVMTSTGLASTLPASLRLSGAGRAHLELVSTQLGDWRLPSSTTDPWSPTGNLLLVVGPSGLAVLDLSQAVPVLRQVAAGRFDMLSWSPDGQWAIGRSRSGSTFRERVFDLIAIRVADGHQERVLTRTNVGHAVWTATNRLLHWNPTAGRVDTLSSPAVLQDAPYRRPAGMTVITRDPLAGRWCGVSDMPAAQDSLHPGVFGDVNIRMVILSPFPTNDSTYLANVYPSHASPYTAVLGSHGEVAVRFAESVGGDAFFGTSVSPDGRYLIGSTTRDAHDGTEGVRLAIMSTDGSQVLSVSSAAAGLFPRFSHQGYFVAFNDQLTGRVRLGVLHVAEN